ncbi:hypothetical protein XH84_14870 [Bradyrhizobium nanningense]|nr:hypothetical protein XH84_14870 [Bradyrhizobium nanningense]
MLGGFKTAAVSFPTAMVNSLRKFASTLASFMKGRPAAFALLIAQPYEPAAGRHLSSRSKIAREKLTYQACTLDSAGGRF